MAEETDPEPQNVEWVPLTEAFNKIGHMKFGMDWDKDTIYLSPGRYRLDMMDEGIPIRINYSMKHTHPEDWKQYLEDLPHEHPIASEEMIAHYDKTKELLLNAIWERKINVEALASDGDVSEVPHKAWKDTTGAFEISFPDSEVRNIKEEGSWETWRVQINSSDLQDFLIIVDTDRRDAIRRKAANENPDKGGAPFKYDWPMIKRYIAEELGQSAKNISNNKIAVQVEKRLEDDGFESPVNSALRAQVKEVREAGLK